MVSKMTEEMVGGQHHNDEATQNRARRVNTRNTRIATAALEKQRTGVPRGGQHARKKLLQPPTSLEIAN
jgi:hypothetical protein